MGLAGPSGDQSLADWVRETSTGSGVGGTAQDPAQMSLPGANYGNNLLRGGGFESWSQGTTGGNPDQWDFTGAGGGTINQNTTNVQEGLYSADIVSALNNTAVLGQQITISATQNTRFRGKRVTFACDVKASSASRAFIRIDDAVSTVDSPYHSGSGYFERLKVVKDIDLAATKILCEIRITSGSAITITADAAMLVEGEADPSFSPHPGDRHLAISNYQTNAPADNIDQGLWRAEIGGADSSAAGVVTVTFAQAFNTIRTVYLTANGDGYAHTETVSTANFTFSVRDAGGARIAEGCAWMAIGQET